MRVLRNATLPISLWHNGAGRKADLATGDGWLAGFAWLDADAPFSRLPGMARTITLIEGPGFTLDVEGRLLPVRSSFAPAQFDGGASTQCRVDGPSRVLNVMTDRGRFAHEVTIVSQSIDLDPQKLAACLVVVLSGTASVHEADTAVALGTLDAAELQKPAAVHLGASSRVAVLRITGLIERP